MRKVPYPGTLIDIAVQQILRVEHFLCRDCDFTRRWLKPERLCGSLGAKSEVPCQAMWIIAPGRCSPVREACLAWPRLNENDAQPPHSGNIHPMKRIVILGTGGTIAGQARASGDSV
jgi:hypothetical protein